MMVQAFYFVLQLLIGVEARLLVYVRYNVIGKREVEKLTSLLV